MRRARCRIRRTASARRRASTPRTPPWRGWCRAIALPRDKPKKRLYKIILHTGPVAYLEEDRGRVRQVRPQQRLCAANVVLQDGQTDESNFAPALLLNEMFNVPIGNRAQLLTLQTATSQPEGSVPLARRLQILAGVRRAIDQAEELHALP